MLSSETAWSRHRPRPLLIDCSHLHVVLEALRLRICRAAVGEDQRLTNGPQGRLPLVNSTPARSSCFIGARGGGAYECYK
jgi:hypothetical protein